MEKLSKEIIKKHGKKVYIIGQDVWNGFIDELKKHPKLYELCKEKFDFTITAIEFELEEIDNLVGKN